MRLNLQFLLFCLPVVTIPAAITALNKVLLNLAREGNAFYGQDFWDEFRSSFLKSWVALLPMMILAGVAFFGYRALDDVYAHALPIVAFLAVCSLAYCHSVYSLTMLALVKLPLGKIMKNAVILTLTEMRRNVLLMIAVFVSLLCAILFPYSLPILLLLLFSFCGLANVMIANEAIEERVVQPFTKQDTI